MPPTTVIAIDWSGRVDPAGQRRHIVAAVWQAARVRVEAGRTRDEVAEWLITLAQQDPALVVGFDFCFSYPAWFVRETGATSGPAFWNVVAREGEHWLQRAGGQTLLNPPEAPRFWGKPHKRPAEFSGDNIHRMLRSTDIDCKLVSVIADADRAARVRGITPKSPFQVGGSGSVGTASLRGIPLLPRLRTAGFRVWPFDPPAPGEPLVVEMYTRLNTGPVHKSNAAARAAYLARKRADDPAWRTLARTRQGREALAAAHAGEDAFDALVSCMVMAAHRDGFDSLPEPQDPAAALEGWTWAPDAATACR